MNTDTPLDQVQDKEVSAKELDKVLDANKDLYDKLNQIPEIEAIEAISLEEEIVTEREKTSNTLSELIDNEVRDVVVRVDVSDVNEQLVNNVVDIITEHKGKHSLVLNVVDNLNNYEVDLLSRKMKVDLNKEFFEKIRELNHLKLLIK